MDRPNEVNDTILNSTASPPVKNKENIRSPKPETYDEMETPAISGSQDNRWLCISKGKKLFNHRGKKSRTRQHYQPYVDYRTIYGPQHQCPVRSAESLSDNLGGKSQSQFEHSGLRVCPNEEVDVVAELTLSNYKNRRLLQDGCSNSTDDVLERKDYHGPTAAPDDSMDGMPNGGTTNLYLNSFNPQRSGPRRQEDCSRVITHTSEAVEISGPGEFISASNRCKTSAGYGLPLLHATNPLKGKGIAQGHLGGSHDFVSKSGCMNRQADGSDSKSVVQHEITLRQWLATEVHNVHKSDRFLLFRDILELVEAYHSQGLALHDLSPSYIIVKSPKNVRYIGSFCHQGSNISPEVMVDRDTFCSGIQFGRRGKLEADKQVPVAVSVKQQKRDETLEYDFQLHLFPGIIEQKEESRMDDRLRLPAQEPTCNFLPQYIIDGEQRFGRNIEQPAFENFQLEKIWYTSPEQMSGNNSWIASNIYNLGVLLFELFCLFKSWDMRAAAMGNLRHRILPPRFLSESPKEAGFCLWLLHPEPSLRPTSREILQCEFMCETPDRVSVDQALKTIDKECAETDMLLHFLLFAKDQKEKGAAKLVEELRCLSADIGEVERRNLRRIERSGHSRSSSTYKNFAESFLSRKNNKISSSGEKQGKVLRNISHLEHAYFSTRSEIDTNRTTSAACKGKDSVPKRDKFQLTSSKENDRLGAFFDGLCKYARYNKFEVVGTVRNADILSSANVICSLSFDRDEDYLATAGISKKIKIFDFGALLNDSVDVHYPVVELHSKSRLSCVSWNNYIKNYLASTDYDGTVQIWDASTGQGFMKFTNHQKRAWSVDFSPGDPTKLASGSDDSSVKLWSIKEKNCISSIRTVAQVCCVQFSPNSSHLLSFGSADYKIYFYDLRNTRVPLSTLAEHRKPVSYVKFVDPQTLVSASTDNTLKLWDLHQVNSNGLTAECSLTLRGHTNEKNFVGLSVSNGYIACGSETNEVYAYYKSLPMPITCHKFGSMDPVTAMEVNDDTGQFVSSVCWRGKSNMVVAANSTGCLKLLELV
ncbi:protein SPA1-RELATED 4-like [Wolffia australiana]